MGQNLLAIRVLFCRAANLGCSLLSAGSALVEKSRLERRLQPKLAALQKNALNSRRGKKGTGTSGENLSQSPFCALMFFEGAQAVTFKEGESK